MYFHWSFSPVIGWCPAKVRELLDKYSEILLVEVLHHFAAKVIELNDSPVLIHRIFFPDIWLVLFCSRFFFKLILL